MRPIWVSLKLAVITGCAWPMMVISVTPGCTIEPTLACMSATVPAAGAITEVCAFCSCAASSSVLARYSAAAGLGQRGLDLAAGAGGDQRLAVRGLERLAEDRVGRRLRPGELLGRVDRALGHLLLGVEPREPGSARPRPTHAPPSGRPAPCAICRSYSSGSMLHQQVAGRHRAGSPGRRSAAPCRAPSARRWSCRPARRRRRSTSVGLSEKIHTRPAAIADERDQADDERAPSHPGRGGRAPEPPSPCQLRITP